jgi:protein involved in polysaccharide export with SLBB domain
MQVGEGKSFWRMRQTSLASCGLGLLLALLAGCSTSSQQIDHALMADKSPAASQESTAAEYRIGCPDRLDIRIPEHPEIDGTYIVGANGRVALGNLGQVRIEGKSIAQAATLIADQAQVPVESVKVRIQDYRSQQVYLVGEVHGLQRAVPYQGPERVADLLQRVGGLAPGAATADVKVIRAHVAEGKAPEVFPVDLQSILLKRDQRTNVLLQPFDEIMVGETRQSYLAHSLPPLLLPLYQSLFGLQETKNR